MALYIQLTKTILMHPHILSDVNWLAILVASLAYFFLGAIWYSFLFQKPWIRLLKIDVNDAKMKSGVAAIMVGSFIMMFVTSIVLAMFTVAMDFHHWQDGFHLGFMTGLGIAFTSMAINMLYEKKPVGLYFINGGYQLLGNIIVGVILAVWR